MSKKFSCFFYFMYFHTFLLEDSETEFKPFKGLLFKSFSLLHAAGPFFCLPQPQVFLIYPISSSHHGGKCLFCFFPHLPPECVLSSRTLQMTALTLKIKLQSNGTHTNNSSELNFVSM